MSQPENLWGESGSVPPGGGLMARDVAREMELRVGPPPENLWGESGSVPPGGGLMAQDKQLWGESSVVVPGRPPTAGVEQLLNSGKSYSPNKGR